jgi:virginiamycin B lyase
MPNISVRVGDAAVVAIFALAFSGCSANVGALPGAGSAASTPSLAQPARERIKIRQFADLPQYSSYYGPSAIASGPKKSLWVTDDIDQDFGECAVVEIATSGKATNTFYYQGLSSEGASFQDIVEGPDGALWITDVYNGQILRMTTGGTFTGFPLRDGFSPLDIASGPDGALWFTIDAGSSSMIGRITTKGVMTEYGVARGARGIATGPDGALWFAESTANEIGRITTHGKITQYSRGISADAEPYSIAAGPDGALWFTELTGGRIGRITVAGKITEYSRGITTGEQPSGITSGPDHALWFTEYESQDSGQISESKIGRISASGKIAEYSKHLNSAAAPTGIVEGPDQALWFDESALDLTGRLSL